MDFGRQNKSVISKLRVKGKNLENVAARIHFERLLSNTDLMPQGLSPHTIVCIKKISDPKPATLRLSHTELRFTEAWQKKVTLEIEKLYQKAYYPIREFVPANAESLIFNDYSELLACLAIDYCNGAIAERWWWKSLLPNLNLAKSVAEVWLDAVEFTPGSFQILVDKQKAVQFVEKLDDAEAERLLNGILRVFSLKKLQTALSEPVTKAEIEKVKFQIEESERPAKRKVQAKNVEIEPLSPYVSLVPEIKTIELDFVRQNLVGIGYLLAKSPRRVRSGQIAAKIKIYRTEIEAVKTTKSQKNLTVEQKTFGKKPANIEKSNVSNEKDKLVSLTNYREATSPPSEKSEPVQTPKRTFDEIVFSEEPKPETVEKKITPKAIRPNEAKKSVFNFEETKPEDKTEKVSLQDSKTEPSEKTEKKTAEIDVALETSEQEIADFIFFTRFGGVFYLLNLGIFLSLYRDFTENLAEEIDLNIWDFTALISLEFLGDVVKKDAVWRFLEDWSGRAEGEVLGSGFMPETDWRISTDWLETFQSFRKWSWFTAKNRLIVRHPANFPVIDVELTGDFDVQFAAELDKYRKYFDEIENLQMPQAETFTSFERWLSNLTDYIKARLLQALNLENEAEIGEILFKHTAQVNVSGAHLDINFSLADLPLAVRFSGLDRDPGWIPAAGKFVRFYFV
ncbi:MAG: hypothetical protein LUM44_01345 [Pyrinomonadaceae bacterium]|nr:hypothetical protein [Pyrinomonadaceae bacterium]